LAPNGDLLSASEDGTIKRWTTTPRCEEDEEDMMDACGFRDEDDNSDGGWMLVGGNSCAPGFPSRAARSRGLA
jgi:hypothetical protein